jgi:TIGR00255 family protein
MAIQSMTGFSRGDGSSDGYAWTWEMRSVNARGLDVRCRLPSGFEMLETAVRQRIAARVRRGNVTASLNFAAMPGSSSVRINVDVLEQMLAVAAELHRRLPDSPPPSVEGLMALRGVIETADGVESAETRAQLDEALIRSLEPVIDGLVGQRQREGAHLAVVLTAHIERIADLVLRAVQLAAGQPVAIQARLSEQVSALLVNQPALPPDRLAQEVALLAVRADPREELDRLKAHQQAAAGLLAAGGAMGRQLDFLCQEFNREANTLCSKSADIALTEVALELKTVIDQMREQVQNIE